MALATRALLGQMDVDDVVDTSDVDEQDILDVFEVDHRAIYSPRNTLAHDAFKRSDSTARTSNAFQGSPFRSVDLTPCRSSPRKRLKVRPFNGTLALY